MSKKQEKKIKLNKKDAGKNQSDLDDFEWGNVHSKGVKENNKRSSELAALSPQDRSGRSRSKTTNA